MKTRLPSIAAVSLLAALWLPNGVADDSESIRNLHDTTVNLINALVEQGVISRAKADAMLKEAQESKSNGAGAAADTAVRDSDADTAETLPSPANPSTSEVVKLLVEQGVIDRDDADALMKQAQQEAEAAAPAPSPETPVPTAGSAVVATAVSPAEPLHFNYTDTFDVLGVALPSNHASLERIVQALRGTFIDQIEVTGYTDSTPIKSKYHDQFPDNYALSRVRAQVVADYLAAELDLKPEQVKVVGKGEENPIGDNETEEGRRQNRRVEITVLNHHALPATPQVAEAKGPVRVPFMPEIVKQQIKEELKQEVLARAKREHWGDSEASPSRNNRISWAGDIRVRGESDLFPTDSAPNATPAVLNGPPFFDNINNTSNTANRLRVLARVGLTARISDMVTAGIRVATGGAGGGSNPGTENATLGNYDTRLSIGLDRAYIRIKPVSWASLTAGRLGNPFFTPTDMIWADTVSLEGVSLKFSDDLLDNVTGILIAGAFPIQQRDNEIVSAGVGSRSKWLFAYQTGLDWGIAPADDLRVAMAFYDYRRVEGVLAPDVNNIDQFDWSSAGFRQKGNQAFDIHGLLDQSTGATPSFIGLVSRFREVNFSTAIDLGNFAPTHVILKGDFVRNIGFRTHEIENRTGITDPSILRGRVNGYTVKLVVGQDVLRNSGEWQAFGGYRRVERDAVLDAFNDQDFHLGGTDAKGYFVGGKYEFAKSTAVGVRWLSANQINGLPLAIDVLQIDLTTSF